MAKKITFTPDEAQQLVSAFDLDVIFDNEEELELMETHNPELLEVYRKLWDLAHSE